jgi:hypothetical protein
MRGHLVVAIGAPDLTGHGAARSVWSNPEPYEGRCRSDGASMAHHGAECVAIHNIQDTVQDGVEYGAPCLSHELGRLAVLQAREGTAQTAIDHLRRGRVGGRGSSGKRRGWC